MKKEKENGKKERKSWGFEETKRLVKLWQGKHRPEEIAEKLGRKTQDIQQKVQELKKKGIELKDKRTGRSRISKIEMDELKSLAKESYKKDKDEEE